MQLLPGMEGRPAVTPADAVHELDLDLIEDHLPASASFKEFDLRILADPAAGIIPVTDARPPAAAENSQTGQCARQDRADKTSLSLCAFSHLHSYFY